MCDEDTINENIDLLADLYRRLVKSAPCAECAVVAVYRDLNAASAELCVLNHALNGRAFILLQLVLLGYLDKFGTNYRFVILADLVE